MESALEGRHSCGRVIIDQLGCALYPNIFVMAVLFESPQVNLVITPLRKERSIIENVCRGVVSRHTLFTVPPQLIAYPPLLSFCLFPFPFYPNYNF